MPFKKGHRKGHRRGMRHYARRLAHRAHRGLKVGPRLFGFKKDGFHVSDAIIVASPIIAAFVPATTGANSSPVEMLMGKGAWASQTMAQRAQNAAFGYLYTTLGVNKMGTAGSTYGAFGAIGVGSGMAMKIAGKFINPWMGGSAIKL